MNVFNNTNGKSTITIDGVSIEIPNASNITIKDGKIFVNNKEYFTDIIKNKNVEVKINGNIQELNCKGNITIHGDVGEIDCKGNITVNGNCGSIQCKGNVICN